MVNIEFIGRRTELTRLGSLLRAKTARLAVIKGRRRVGKSRLFIEFAKNSKYYRLVGLAPDKHTTAQSQRNHFASQLRDQTDLPELKTNDWLELFKLLNERTRSGRVIIILDEITWMGSKDPEFLGKLHYVWEEYFKANPELTLILCGSVSAWIEKNILSSTGYFGRVSLTLTLDELPILHCNRMMDNIGFKGSSYEKLILLSVMGCIPWYIENIDPGLSMVENIKSLCFVKDALLVKEFDSIFNDLFSEKRREIQRRIVMKLADGPMEHDEIREALGYASSGSLTEYLEELILSGFVSRDFVWSFNKAVRSTKVSKYRLRDNYLRFYLKYILPKKDRIDSGQYSDVEVSLLPGWNSIIGLQFENLVINNRKLLFEKLNINPINILQEGPYFQRKTTKKRSCQIDYLIQTKFKTVYVFEIKFSTNTIGVDVVEAVKEKINRLALPKGMACIPVLIHANHVSSNVMDQEYFASVINVVDWLSDD